MCFAITCDKIENKLAGDTVFDGRSNEYARKNAARSGFLTFSRTVDRCKRSLIGSDIKKDYVSVAYSEETLIVFIVGGEEGVGERESEEKKV